MKHRFSSVIHTRLLRLRDTRAKVEAYNEAAEHLRLTWTLDPVEIAAGNTLSAKLGAERDRLMDRVHDMERAVKKSPGWHAHYLWCLAEHQHVELLPEEAD